MMLKKRQTPVEILDHAKELLTDRGAQYGAASECFERASIIATTVLKKNISSYDIAMIMVSMKLARVPESPLLDDHYVDMINYAAFGSHLATSDNQPKDANGAAVSVEARRSSKQKDTASDNSTLHVPNWIDPINNGR